MKKLLALGAGFLLLIFTSGCEVSPGYGYGGAVYGEYPSTYYGTYSPAPVYPYYGYHYDRWAPYDRDHYWDRGRHFERRDEHFRHHDRDRDDWHH